MASDISNYILRPFQHDDFVDMDVLDVVQGFTFTGMQFFWIAMTLFEIMLVYYFIFGFIVSGIGQDIKEDFETVKEVVKDKTADVVDKVKSEADSVKAKLAKQSEAADPAKEDTTEVKKEE